MGRLLVAVVAEVVFRRVLRQPSAQIDREVGERQAEHVQRGVHVFARRQSAQSPAPDAAARDGCRSRRRIVDPRQHGRQFVGGRTRAALGRHFPLRHQAFGREPLLGELRFYEVRQRTVETHLPFLLLGAMTGDAMFLEERPNHQGKRASVRVVVRGTGL